MKSRKCWIVTAIAMIVAAQTIAADFAMTNEKPAPSAQSDTALPLLRLELGIDNNPGWVALVKGGYQWKLFRNVGYTINGAGGSHSKSGNHTKSGPAASVGFAYNFGERFPLTIGLGIGFGPGGRFNTRSVVGDFDIRSRQKVSLYDFDLSIDYEFMKTGCWTPFIGLTGGVTFTTDKGRMSVTSISDGATATGSYNKTHHVNFIGGGKLGTKWRLNERVTLSLYGSYEYLGTFKEREFTFDNAAQFAARTRKIRAHQIGATAGLKIKF